MNRIKQVFAIMRIATQPGGLRAFLSWKPFSITAWRMARDLKSQCPGLQTVVDGGANVGQFARALLETYPGCRVISIEPLPEVCGELRANLAGSNARVEEVALGPVADQVTFHRNAYSLASSVLPMKSEENPMTPGARVVDVLTVEQKTLDELLADEPLSGPALLKLDLQGYELPALQGATATLNRVDFVLTEIATEASYVGEAGYDEISGFLKEHGFSYVGPMDTLTDDAGNVTQIDALFRKAKG